MSDAIFPIGKYEPQDFSEEGLRERLLDIRFLPNLMENTIQHLDEFQLNETYREGSWTIKQIVHHVADSHMNAFIRLKLGLTENNPTVKPYSQDDWAVLADTELPVNISITFLYALHLKWHELMINMERGDWDKTIYHPEYKITITLWNLLGMYAWHGKHHAAQISTLIEKKGWK
jgi:hypothetical protein